MITKEYKQYMEDKQQAREFFELSQTYGTDGMLKDFFNKTPFPLNDIADKTDNENINKSAKGSKFTKPKNKRKK